jgi:hypothetical protein
LFGAIETIEDPADVRMLVGARARVERMEELGSMPLQLLVHHSDHDAWSFPWHSTVKTESPMAKKYLVRLADDPADDAGSVVGRRPRS